MKTIFKPLFIVIVLVFLLSTPSCIVVKHDRGKHKGWFKNPKNPHHPLHKPDVVKPPKHIHKGKGKGKKK